MSRVVTIVAKGLSANNAVEYIARVQTDIAVIHEAAALVPGRQIQWCFATHACTWPLILSNAARITTFVTPQNMLVYDPVAKIEEWRDAETPEFAAGRHIKFESCLAELWDNSTEALNQKITGGRICHYSTVNGALHWLAKYGKYDRIRIIGVGAGTAYADGMTAVNTLVDTLRQDDPLLYSKFKDVTDRLCTVLENVYDVRIEWYAP